jgi:ferric-dicitrate binding protein FerR (iron transport regulator)
MKDEEQHIDYDLLGKYLSGECSEEEAKSVETWRSSSKSNQDEFDRLARLWREADSLVGHTPAPVNLDTAWDKLHGRLFGDEVVTDKSDKEEKTGVVEDDISKREKEIEIPVRTPGRETKVRHLSYYLSRIAAVLAVGLLVYSFFIMTGGDPEQVVVLAENDITITDLPDDTKVTLNENTKITYPEKFNSEERAVELTGEAYFEVERNEEKPFVVRAHNAVVRVLGTSFNVRAIEEETEISVTVEEGKVRLSDEEDVAFVILEKNEKGIFNRSTGHIEKYEKSEGGEMFWRSRTVMFRDTELSTVFETLEKLYDTEILAKNEDILSCMLSAKFQDMDLEEILDKIAINFNLTIEKNNNTFEISGDGC